MKAQPISTPKRQAGMATEKICKGVTPLTAKRAIMAPVAADIGEPVMPD